MKLITIQTKLNNDDSLTYSMADIQGESDLFEVSE